MRILIVEDELLLVMDLEQLLQHWGYHVCGSANTAEEAVAKAIDLRPDLVLMDLHLADGSSGLKAAHCIRDRLGIASLFVTGNDIVAELKEIDRLDPVAILSKPFHPEALRAALLRAERQLDVPASR